MSKKPNLLKARLLFPFAKRYRTRLRLAPEPEELRIIASHILVTDNYRLAFVKNAKAGCTTVSHILFFYARDKVFNGRIHDDAASLIQGADFSVETISAIKNSDVYKFSFVRNPTDRLISAFHNFVLEGTNRGSSRHLRHMESFGYSPSNTHSDNFNAFLNYIEHCLSISSTYTDQHFRHQTKNIAHGHVDYSYIGKLESLSEDMEHIFKDSGEWRDNLRETLTIKANASKSPRYTPSERQLKRVSKIYEEDYEAFGYPLPIHV